MDPNSRPLESKSDGREDVDNSITFDGGITAGHPSGLNRCILRRTTDRACTAFHPAVDFSDEGQGGNCFLGSGTMGAYALGYHSAPVSHAPVRATAPQSGVMQSVAFSGPAAQLSEPASTPRATSAPVPPGKVVPEEKPSAGNTKRKVEVALTAAAIAAIIIQASRAQYHAGGRPCACPDDTMRNGRACGERSAYSRPRGASPLCYPSDVTTAMIESYRQKMMPRQALGR
jgi:hypothetical protein